MVDLNLEFARGGAFLTAELFEILPLDGVKQNIVFSPFAIQTCIALAFAGAQGETADEIAKGLHFISKLPPQVAKTFKCVLKKYKDSSQLKIANALYVQEGKQLRSSYKEIVKEQYYAKAKSINFALSDAAAELINTWVSSKTEGKITKLVSADSFDEQTRMVLLNAMHFKGKWLHDFMEKDTKEKDFWVSEKESVKVHYMYQKEYFGYADFPDLECIALDMPYKKSDLSMLVLLPQKREGLMELVKKLKTVNLVDLAGKLVNQEVNVHIPKFKVDYSVDLTDTMKQVSNRALPRQSLLLSLMM